MSTKPPAPGPYEVVPVEDARDKSGNGFFMIRNEQGAIATVYPNKEAEGTANLLAAAPDLLQNLKEIAGFLAEYPQWAKIPPRIGHFAQLASADLAIAKAEKSQIVERSQSDGPAIPDEAKPS
jgi:hypothetical protein